ncbi:MAG: VWA domain-containing protein [Thermoflexales bacterium]|nr:VWA domain-containing protein [Thermoflexales bacterium]
MSFSFLYPTSLYALLLLPPLLALPFLGRRALPRAFSFWAGLVLRALVMLGLILGLAGAQLVRAVHDTTVVFVLDHSDSVPPAEQKRAEDFIRESLVAMREGDRAAIVVFGQDALVDRLASEEKTLAPVVSIPRSSRTNIASALRLALALFPEETHKRIVLLSDGLENVGRAEELVELAEARGVQIDVVPLSRPAGGEEAYLDALEAPAAVRQGQAFELVAVVHSTLAGPATLRLFGDGKLIATQQVSLQAGESRFSFSLTAEEAGFRRYTAELQAPGDSLAQNNTAAAFTVVHGPPRLLVVEGSAGDADNLLAALESSGIGAERVAPADLPPDLAALSSYDAVFLVNVKAKALPDAAMKALPSYVRELGRGLVMVGGPDSYGAGGYLRTPLEAALPVDMDVRSRTQEPNLALVFAIDKSGSMGRCHCDDPSLNPGQYVRAESGLSKVDIAKDAVMQAASLLGRTDYIGVVAFDSSALWALRVQELSDPDAIQQSIGGLRPEGQTNIYAGLSEAEAALARVDARLKHVILLTDGWSNAGDYDALARRMQEEGITLSIVAAGGGSRPGLADLAGIGGGRYYAAPTMTDVPQLFFKETIEAVGSYIIEEPILPLPAGTTPILRGLDVVSLPALRGYNGTTPKVSARVALLSGQGDPLLASWQYGLGRAVAWTSDLKGQWATEWVAWEQFNTFVAQLANWVMPQPADEGIQLVIGSSSAAGGGGQAEIELLSRDEAGLGRDFLDTRATIVGPDYVSQTIELAQVGPGRYRGRLPAAQPGSYLVHVVQRDASGVSVAGSTAGWVVPYSPEYKWLSQAASVLPALAGATGGAELAEPGLAFAPLATPATHAQPVWPALLLAAALLFPLDVAVRRLRLTDEDWRAVAAQLAAWLWLPLERGRAAVAHPRALGALFAARDRARTARVARREGTPTPAIPPRGGGSETSTPALPPRRGGSEPPASEAPASPEDVAGRLRQARDRARKPRR